MKPKLPENSLFAVLLRKPWWISIGIAVVLALAMAAMLPQGLSIYSISAGLPFLAIGLVAAVRQWNLPSPARVAQMLETATAMSWRDFSAAVEQAYRRDGYEVARRTGAADFEIAKAGHTSLVGCKRWKAASNGIEPLRELHAAAEACDARESIYLTAGELTDNARRFAQGNGIRVVQGAALAQLLQGTLEVKRGAK